MSAQASPKRLMIFFRKDCFYPVEFTARCTVAEHVRLNPGTLKVMDGVTGEVLWIAPEIGDE